MKSTDIVIIGGVVLGGAIAYYLAKEAAWRVILLERNSIAHENSSLAAGLITRGRTKPMMPRRMKRKAKKIVRRG
jgi:glycine/D-amino acid oxidase-like deaminating enzyme